MNCIIILNTYSVMWVVINFINLLNFIFLNFSLGLGYDQMNVEQEKRKIPWTGWRNGNSKNKFNPQHIRFSRKPGKYMHLCTDHSWLYNNIWSKIIVIKFIITLITLTWQLHDCGLPLSSELDRLQFIHSFLFLQWRGRGVGVAQYSWGDSYP